MDSGQGGNVEKENYYRAGDLNSR